MRRGDFLPQAGWNWHAHHNATSEPMAWIDGLDIPFQFEVESQFFTFGRDELTEAEHQTPERSRSQRLWGHAGIAPVSQLGQVAGSPLLCYRWHDTDSALADQLALEREGYPGVIEPGHALIRFTNPTSGGDVLPTIRTQFHRVAAGAETAPLRETRSSMAPGELPWATTPGRSAGATSSWFRRGCRSRPGPRRPRPTPIPAHLTCSSSATPLSSPS
jgi:gentisate 1,2-dioxygenase